MKYTAAFLALAFLGLSPLLAQSPSPSSRTIPPGFIDGSQSPQLIPDRAAYRLVLLSLAVSNPGDQKALAKQKALLMRIGLSDSDKTVFIQALTAFAGSYASWKQMVGAGATDDEAWAIVQSTRNTLQSQLSSDGNSKFSAYVALAKRYMIVKP